MKTLSELNERSKSLQESGAQILKTFLTGFDELATELDNLEDAREEFDLVYGYDVENSEENDEAIVINLRQPITSDLKAAINRIPGVAAVAEDDRYRLYIRKGVAFTWKEIQGEFEKAYAEYVDPIIQSAELANQKDMPTGDVSQEQSYQEQSHQGNA